MIVNLCVLFAGILCSLKFCISATRNFFPPKRGWLNGWFYGGGGWKLRLQWHRVAWVKLNQSVCVASREQTGHRDGASLMTRPRPRAITEGGICVSTYLNVYVCVWLRLLLLPRCVNSFTSMSQTASYKRVKWSCKLGGLTWFSFEGVYRAGQELRFWKGGNICKIFSGLKMFLQRV